MKISIMQPYIFPYIGYFHLIHACELFIAYDDVDFIKQGWINRNNLTIGKEKQLFTIPLKKVSSNSLIKESIVSDKPGGWEKKFLNTIQFNYRKATYYKEIYPIVEAVVMESINKPISEVAVSSISAVLEYLGLFRTIKYSSRIYENHFLKGQERILDICNMEKANVYINPIGGQALYSKEIFRNQGIELYFIKSIFSEYKNLNGDFIPGLSIIDILMNCHKNEVVKMLESYELI